MAAITTQRAGNWSDTTPATTPWTALNGSGAGGVPGAGDTITISHAVVVDANASFGTSAATPAVELTVAAAGSLTVAPGKVLNAKGDLQLQNSVLTLQAGAIYEFDSSAAAATPRYKIRMSSAGSQQNTKFVCQGTASQRCQVRKAAGSGNGIIGPYSNGASAWGQFNCVYTDFKDLGAPTFGYDLDSFMIHSGNTAVAEVLFERCVFDACGRFNLASLGAANNFTFRFNEVKANCLNQYAAWFTFTAASTGNRIITDNLFPTQTHYGTAITRQVVLAGSPKNVVFERNILSALVSSAIADYTPWTSFKNNLFVTRSATATNAAMVNLPFPGSIVEENHFLCDAASGDPAGIYTPNGAVGSGGATPTVLDGNIFEATTPNEDGDSTHWNNPTSAYRIQSVRNIVLPNSRGRSSGSMNGHGNRFVTVEFENNTLMTSDNTSPSVTGGVAIWTGSGYVGHAGMYAKIRRNLVWSRFARGGSYGNLIAHTSNSTGPWSGNATGGSNNTLTVSTTTFPITAGLRLSDVAAVVVITAKTGNGPAVGELRTITANTNNSITVGSDFSAVPDTGTGYRIFSTDTIGGVEENATYNVGSGNVFDATGANSVSRPGYNGFWQTDTSLGATDVDLGAGTDETAAGPQFVDTSRNLATFDREFLQNTSVTPWATATAYVVGDVRSNSAGAFYGGRTINYRCVADHTSGATTAPGSGSAWRTNWELASVQSIRQAILAGTSVTDAALGLSGADYILALARWVKHGYRPRNASVNGIGAMPLLAPSNTAPTANAGVDTTITLPAAVTLNGSASDAEGAVTTTWSKVSGPGTVAFANANSLNTTATFGAAGNYVLRLTASDGSLQGQDDIAITVNAEVVVPPPAATVVSNSVVFAGLVAVVTPGTRVRLPNYQCSRISITPRSTNAGRVYVGNATLNKTTLAGVGKIFNLPTSIADVLLVTATENSGNVLSSGDLWIDAATAGDGVLVTVWIS